jgi:hypothetical protein
MSQDRDDFGYSNLPDQDIWWDSKPTEIVYQDITHIAASRGTSLNLPFVTKTVTMLQ